MAEVKLYTARSNFIGVQTREFVAESDEAAEYIATVFLNCQPDEVVLVHRTVDSVMDADVIARATRVVWTKD